MSRTAFQRREAPAGAAGLGNTGSKSGAIFSNTRQRRFELRRKMQKHADRTMILRTDWETVSGAYGMEDREQHLTEFPRDDRFLACGRRSRTSGGGAGVVYDGETGSAGFAGLQACGSVWSCPVCAAKIQSKRSRELGHVLEWARAEGHTIAMVTLTVRHDQSMPLASPPAEDFAIDPVTGEITEPEPVIGVWDAVRAGWDEVTSGKEWASEGVAGYSDRLENWHNKRELALEQAENGPYQNLDSYGQLVTHKARMPRGGHAGLVPQRRIGDQEKFGILGWVRAVEVTHGDNGWHVHIHAVLVLKGSQTSAAINAFAAGRRMWERWQRGIGSVGFNAVEGQGGLDIRLATAAEKRLAEYLQKDGLTDDDKQTIREDNGSKARATAREATLGAGKTGRKGGRTPFQVLEDLDETGFDSPPGSVAHRAASRDLAIWREWVRGSEGRRQLTWSSNLRKLAKLGAEQTNQEIVDEAPAGDLVFWMPAETWHAVRDESWVVLDVIERAGVQGLADWFRYRDLEFQFIPVADDD